MGLDKQHDSILMMSVEYHKLKASSTTWIFNTMKNFHHLDSTKTETASTLNLWLDFVKGHRHIS